MYSEYTNGKCLGYCMQGGFSKSQRPFMILAKPGNAATESDYMLLHWTWVEFSGAFLGVL